MYIDAVAAMGGSTGFLTPTLEPFFGGTYFPRHGGQGRPGFDEVLRQVQTRFAENPDAVAQQGRQLLQQIERAALQATRQPGEVTPETFTQAMDALQRHRDPVHGGFGSRQKFPQSPLLLAELRYVQRTGDEATRQHLVSTLEHMLAGGIRDHLAGTFHRYTVDPRWHIPHFEKTLYDNAQLAALYIETGRHLERDDFIQAGRAILDDLIANWQQPEGGMIVGFDADDAGGEGTYYTWTPKELEQVLGPEDAKLIAAAYGVTEQGDRELQGRSVLHRQPTAEIAKALGLDESEVESRIEAALPELKAARSKRPAPAVDHKQLTAWNALALMAMADAARWLEEPRYEESAKNLGTFLENQTKNGALTRGTANNEPLGEAVLADYALTALALHRLHATTADTKHLHTAHALTETIVKNFYDATNKTFLQTPSTATDLPIRLADLEDNVLPSGGSAATLLLLEQGALRGDTDLLELPHQLLKRTAGHLKTNPTQAGFLLVALDHATTNIKEVVISGDPQDPKTQALRSEVRPTTFANILPIHLSQNGPGSDLATKYEALEGKVARKHVDGQREPRKSERMVAVRTA